jgi:hypothetical protein
MRQLMDDARSRAHEMLAGIDLDLVAWARGELNIWADPA